MNNKDCSTDRPNPHEIIYPNPDNIPSQLKSRPNWVVFTIEAIDKPNGTRKLNKIPIGATSKQRGVQNKPDHWSDFATAWKAYEQNHLLSGVGYCMDGGDIVAIDIDDCIDDGGSYTSLALEVLALFDSSYVEISPSGKGLRAFVLGSIPKDISKPVEIYQARGKRYVTVTGKRISNGTNVIHVAEFDAWYAKVASSCTNRNSSLEHPMMEYEGLKLPENIGLEQLSHHSQCILHGEKWDSYYNDGSMVLFGFCKDALRAGYSREEVAALCLDTQYALAEIVARHTNNGLEARQLEWLLKYNIDKAQREVAAEANSEPLSTHNPILDDETRYCAVDLLRHVHNNHLMKRLAVDVANATHLPPNGVFLMGLAVFSSLAIRQFSVCYQDGTALPIGLYVVCEQPSGTGKSRCLNTFQKPFRDMVAQAKRELARQISEMEGVEDHDEEALAVLIEKSKTMSSPLFVTNATPEGLENTLKHTNGFFAAVSSEQGLFDSMLGMSYTKGADNKAANNNDLVLNGFDGGYVASIRVSRKGFSGYVAGSVVCFAQQGSIEKVLSESRGTGLSERFLMLAEPHILGNRDHRIQPNIDTALLLDYEVACKRLESALQSPSAVSELHSLTISSIGHQMIVEYRNSIEPHLADGGKFAHISLRGAASKIDMQIMKIAANLHLLNSNDIELTISDDCIQTAISICNELLEANLALCQNKGLIGAKAEYKSVLGLFTANPKPRTERDIIQSKSQTQPFKDYTGKKSDRIREVLSEMVGCGLLARTIDPTGKSEYVLAQ